MHYRLKLFKTLCAISIPISAPFVSFALDYNDPRLLQDLSQLSGSEDNDKNGVVNNQDYCPINTSLSNSDISNI